MNQSNTGNTPSLNFGKVPPWMEEGTSEEKFKEFFRRKAGIEEVKPQITDPRHIAHNLEKDKIIEIEKALSFSHGLSMTEEELKVDHILKRLKI